MIKKNQLEKIPNRIYYLLFLTPVLAQYSVLNGKLDFDVIAFMYIICFFVNRGITKINTIYSRVVWVYLIYTVLIVFSNWLEDNLLAGSYFDVLLRAGRYCIYFYVASLMLSNNIVYRDAMIVYRRIVLAASAYLFVQVAFFYLGGISLPNTFRGISSNIVVKNIARLQSFYSEPADMAYSIIPFICFSLFGEQYRYKDTRMVDAVIASIAIFASTSSQGTAVVLILWVTWEVLNIGKLSRTSTILFFLLIPIGLYLAIHSNTLLYSLGRLGGLDQGDYSSSAWAARNGGYIVFNSQTVLKKIFGNGYGNYFSENTYG